MQEEIFIRECGVTISQVVTASYYENIKGEMTLSFQVPTEQVQRVEVGQRLEFGRQYFDIVSMEQSIAEGRFLTTIGAEQISLSLADEEYDLESFVFSGTAEDALDAILDDTDFYGYISSNSGMHVEFNHTGTINRRALLHELCGKIQCELQYDHEMIELVSPEDSRGMINVEDYPMIEFNISRTKDGTTYELVTNRFDELAVGATAYIELREPYNIFERSRVIALSYNPFYRKEIVVTMGDYQPDIIDEMVDDREETENIRDSLKDYVTNDIFDNKVSSSIDTYINSEGGKSSLVHSLKGEYVTTDEATGFVTKQNVSAEIAAYVDSYAGTAQITQKLEGTFLKEDALGNYVQKTSLSTEIGSYIDTQAGTAKIISEASGTYQKKSDMTGYVTTTNLNTSIGQYIDNNSAKIVSAVSGTYQTKSGMSDYAKVTAVNTIEQSVTKVESKISLTSAFGSNTIGSNVRALLTLVTNADSSSIKLKADAIEIDGTVYLKASDYLVSGSTMIKGDKIQTSELRFQSLKTTTGDYVIDYNLSTIAIGGGTGDYGSFADCQYIDIVASKACRFEIGYRNFGFYYEDYKVVLRTNNTAHDLRIGSSTYPIDAIYCEALYVDGKAVTGGSSSSTTSLKETDIKKIYCASSTAYYIELTSLKQFKPDTSGAYDLGTTTHPFKTLYIGSGSSYYWKFTADSILPSSTSTSYFNIGSSTYPANKVYVRELYINGTKLDTGSSSGSSSANLSNQAVSLGGNTSYYIVASTGREFRPNSTSTLYPFYLGSSTYYWHYAYIGSTETRIGNSASSKLGFFGTTAVARQTVSSSATVAQLITALKAYGLIY